MLNIMICGFPEVQVSKLKAKIDTAMASINLGGDAITSIVNMRTESCDGKKTPMPYLRVCSTKAGEMSNICEALKIAGVGVDVEFLKLDDFVPAAEME